jgi:hypothetical protein
MVRIHLVMRCFLAFTRIHVTGPGLQRLGSDRQNQDEGQKFHVANINHLLVQAQAQNVGRTLAWNPDSAGYHHTDRHPEPWFNSARAVY